MVVTLALIFAGIMLIAWGEHTAEQARQERARDLAERRVDLSRIAERRAASKARNEAREAKTPEEQNVERCETLARLVVLGRSNVDRSTRMLKLVEQKIFRERDRLTDMAKDHDRRQAKGDFTGVVGSLEGLLSAASIDLENFALDRQLIEEFETARDRLLDAREGLALYQKWFREGQMTSDQGQLPGCPGEMP